MQAGRQAGTGGGTGVSVVKIMPTSGSAFRRPWAGRDEGDYQDAHVMVVSYFEVLSSQGRRTSDKKKANNQTHFPE